MSIEIITEFPTNASVRTWAYVNKNEPSDNSLTDPTAIVCSVIDPDGTTQADAEAMSKSAIGVYYHDYHLGTTAVAMDKGRWRGEVKVTDGSGATAIISVTPFSFKVR